MSTSKNINFKPFKPQGLTHGGRILAAVEKYQINKEDWIDLSTGLNPNGWPVPKDIPAAIWQSLPEESDGLQKAACEYYGCDSCLPIAGSQAAIQILPTLRAHSKVGVISPTYAEHEYNWKQAGHDVIQISINDVAQHINTLDVLIVINPNNPTGEVIAPEKLSLWHQHLANRGGWLIVDEAFMDVTPEKSLLSLGIKPGLIILRSMGKFFGIAGIRCGFVISDHELLQRLAEKIGPWSLTGPTRYVAKRALIDEHWQTEIREKLIESSLRLHKVLSQAGLSVKGGTALFQWLEHTKAKDIFDACAEKGLLIRFFKKEHKMLAPSLRFGLPSNEQDWKKLEEILISLSKTIPTTKTNINEVNKICL